MSAVKSSGYLAREDAKKRKPHRCVSAVKSSGYLAREDAKERDKLAQEGFGLPQKERDGDDAASSGHRNLARNLKKRSIYAHL